MKFYDKVEDFEEEILELKQEIKELKDDYRIIQDALYQRRYQDALAYLDQMLHPRWRSVAACRNDYKASFPPPPPKRGLWSHLE